MLLIDSPLGHYQLLHQIGSGGTGTMYLAQDSRTSREVALKVVSLDDASQAESTLIQRLQQLFTHEMQTLIQLDHASLLPVLDAGWENVSGTSYAYIAMQYCPAGSLANWLQQGQGGARLSLFEISRVLIQAAEALHYAHERGVVHQDVKPSNLLLSAPATHSTILPDLLLTDFRCASFFASISDRGLSQSDYVRTTSFYLPPEQWGGKVVPASDQYALAVLAFYLLTGQFPFQGSLGRIYHQHCTTPPPAPSSLNTQLSPLIDEIILRALDKEPAKRYPSILAFAQAFANLPQVANHQQSTLLSSPSGIPMGANTVAPSPSSPAPSLERLAAASSSSGVITANPAITRTAPPLPPLPLPITPRRRASRLWIRLVAAVLILALALAGGLVIILHIPKTGIAVASVPDHRTVVITTPTSIPTTVPTHSLKPTPTITPLPNPTHTPTPTVIHTTLVDYLNDMSKLYSYTANLGLDQNNSQWMHGDTSLLARGANTYENAVWKLPGMNSFLAVVYFWPPQSSSPLSDLAVSVSADGVHWTATTPSVGDGSGGDSSWIRYTYTLTHLSHVNFVRISWITTATDLWAEQVGQVTLNS